MTPTLPESLAKLLDNLLLEVQAKEGIQYWSSHAIDTYPGYQKIKALDDEDKKVLVFFLIPTIAALQTKNRAMRAYRNGVFEQMQERRYRDLLHLLLRSNRHFNAEELIRLFTLLRQSCQKEAVHFSDWPINYAVKQIELHIKKAGVDKTLGTFLKSFCQWPELNQNRSHYTFSKEKITSKIKKLLFDSAIQPGRVAPCELPDDQFGQFLNPKIKALPTEEQNHWYTLFHFFLKASAARPSASFLKQSSLLINQIGTVNFKKAVQEWMGHLCKMEDTKAERTYGTKQGDIVWYEMIFIHPETSIFLKGLVWSLVRFHDAQTIQAVARLAEKCFQKIIGRGPRSTAVGNACIYTLAHVRGLSGIPQLSGLRLKIRQANTQRLIEKYIREASERLNISTAEVEERAVPDFGLDRGQKAYAFGEFQLHLKIIGLNKVQLQWIKPDGDSQKSVPSFVKTKKKYQNLLKKVKAEAKQIKKQFSIQKERLDRSFIQNRIWSYENFTQYYFNHGLIHPLVRTLIWEFELDGQFVAAIFHEGRWIDQKDVVINSIPPETRVRLWHPITNTIENITGWRDKLMQLELKQLIKQAYREIYLLTDAEVQTKVYSNRMAAHLLKQHQFNSLAKLRGWRYSLLGAFDDGRAGSIARLAISEHQLEAQFWINEMRSEDQYNTLGIWNYIATDQVRFVKSSGEALDLVDVPQLVFSEVMRHVDLFIGVCSVGNDPQWQDTGGLPQYQDYWTSYSFGQLTQIAINRKAILEKLLPRLTISKVASIEGKYLKVKGHLRNYKIHIGSGNILMEPNDQYLCIVPDSRERGKTTKVFLPFEGDQVLSIILSKAFMLAADDKIKDTSIVSQISFIVSGR